VRLEGLPKAVRDILARRHVGHVGAVALPGVDDGEACGAGGFDYPVDGGQDRPQRRGVIAPSGEISRRRQEILLQVDDE